MTVESPFANPDPPKIEGPNWLARLLTAFGYILAIPLFPFAIRVVSGAWHRYVARTMDADPERVALLAGPGPVELHQHRGRPAATHS